MSTKSVEPTTQNSTEFPFNDVLLQINFDDPKTKQDIKTGQRIAERIWTDQTTNSGNLNFFKARAARWTELQSWAKGTQDMSQFLDFFSVSDSNKAYVKIDMTPIMVGPQFVGTLVESMSKTEEYPCVKAVDANSIEEKEQRKIDALFRMQEVDTISDLQEQSGVMLEPPNAYVPDDELSARVYFALQDQVPKEIKFQEKLSKILTQNQYQRTLKRRFIYDLVVNNIEVSKIEKDIHGNKRIRKCMPQNVIYNFFIGDTGKHELKYIGEVYSLKVSDLRAKYGQSPSRPKGLTEQQIYELAKTSTTINNTNLGINYPWLEQYSIYNDKRPWDDYSVYVFDFEIEICETEYYTNKKDTYGKDNILQKKGKPEPKSPTTEVLTKEKRRWYNGVYAPYAKTMIYWGLPDLVIFPYTDVYHGMSSYTVNIPFNNGEYVPALFERAMEPIKEYALTKLKRKQLIAKLRPSGIRIDIESARNLDLGAGNTIAWEEVLRIFDQTGNELWSSRGVNPNERENPALSPSAQDDTIQKIIQLTNVLQSSIMEIRALLGVPNYRDGADVGDRTAAKLAEMQNTSSFNVTDFISNAHNQFMEEMLYKLCLVEWQDVVVNSPETSDDLINTKFDVSVKMKMTEYQKQLLQQKIDIAMKTIDASTGKPLLSFKDAFMIDQIDDFTLANLYLANVLEENERRDEQKSAKLQEQNAAIQQQTAQQSSEAAAKMQANKLDAEKKMQEFVSNNKKQEILLDKGLDLYKTILTPKTTEEGAVAPAPTLPKELEHLLTQTFENISISLAQDNQMLQEDIMAKAQQEEQEMQQQEQEQLQQQEAQ